MKRKILAVALMLVALAVLIARATTSQVAGYVAASLNLTLTGPQAIGSSTFPLAQPSFLQGSLTYGTTGAGIAHANQLYANQILLTNGTAYLLNLYSLGGGNDPVGNAYTQTQVKMLAFQNLGTTNAPYETNVLYIMGTNSTAAWSSFLAYSNTLAFSIPGPPTNATAANTPTVMFWAPGDVGWLVGASTNNTIVLTNPNPGTIAVNIYVVGSTGE